MNTVCGTNPILIGDCFCARWKVHSFSAKSKLQLRLEAEKQKSERKKKKAKRQKSWTSLEETAQCAGGSVLSVEEQSNEGVKEGGRWVGRRHGES